MESTGKYWVPVFNLLEDSINVTIANPKWVKTIKGNKDDVKDSKWIGDLFESGLFPAALARMVLTAVFHMLTTGEMWNSVDLNQIDMPPELRKKEVQQSLKRALKLLVSHGIVPPDTIQIPEAVPA